METIITTEICNSIGRIYKHSIMWMYADVDNQYDADGRPILYNDEDEHNGITQPVLVEYPDNGKNSPQVVRLLDRENLPEIKLEEND